MGINVFNNELRTFRPRGDIERLRVDVRTKTTVWITFRRVSPRQYDLMGVWVDTPEASAEKLAAASCLDESYFIGPFPVNVALPERVVPWTGSYSPVRRQKALERRRKAGNKD